MPKQVNAKERQLEREQAYNCPGFLALRDVEQNVYDVKSRKGIANARYGILQVQRSHIFSSFHNRTFLHLDSAKWLSARTSYVRHQPRYYFVTYT